MLKPMPNRARVPPPSDPIHPGGNTISFDMFNSPGKMPPAVGERVTLRFATEDLLVITD